MRGEHYQLISAPDRISYEFVSEGSKGQIVKRVVYTKAQNHNVYNLGFGDKTPNGGIDDLVVTNNGDTEKVLATVVATVFAFLEVHPDAWIFATGSTPTRNRLYRMSISKYLLEAEQHFHILGLIDGEWSLFETNKPYTAFLIKSKIEK